MLTAAEKTVINDYKKAVQIYYRNKEVIDIDAAVDRNLDWWMVRLETIIAEVGPAVPPQRQSRFTVLYISEGKGQKQVGTVDVPIQAPMLVVVPARVITSSLYDQNTKGYYLIFNLQFFFTRAFSKTPFAENARVFM